MQYLLTEEEFSNLKKHRLSKEDLDKWEHKMEIAKGHFFARMRKAAPPEELLQEYREAVNDYHREAREIHKTIVYYENVVMHVRDS